MAISRAPRPDDAHAGRLDSALRILRVLVRATMCGHEKDTALVDGMFVFINGNDPKKPDSWTRTTWWDERVREHVKRALRVFWHLDSTPRLDKTKPAPGFESDYLRLITQARNELKVDWHDDPGPPPAAWPLHHAAIVYQQLSRDARLLLQSGRTAADLAEALYRHHLAKSAPSNTAEDMVHCVSIRDSRRILAENHDADPGSPFERESPLAVWELHEAAAVYELMALLSEFGAPIFDTLPPRSETSTEVARRSAVIALAEELYTRLKTYHVTPVAGLQDALDPLHEAGRRALLDGDAEGVLRNLREINDILDHRQAIATEANQRLPETAGGRGRRGADAIGASVAAWARCVTPPTRKQKRSKGETAAAAREKRKRFL